jgi:hypothetical protein
MKLFVLRDDFTIEINKEEVLLVKEFEELFSLKFNKDEKGDMDGRKRQKAHKVLAYIYLVYDWKSPYSEYSPREKHEAATLDTGLSEEILRDQAVINAIRKYMELQDTRILKLLRSSYQVVDKIRHHFETVDLSERDPESGKPIFTAKDLMANLASLGKTVESLSQLEHIVKKEQEMDRSLRGDAEPGMFDTK